MVEKVSFKEIIGTEHEPKFLTAVENFKCQDEDVEKFLKEKALDFAKNAADKPKSQRHLSPFI